MTIVAPLNVPSLLAQDASELYAKNIAALLALMMKDNIITLNWNERTVAVNRTTALGNSSNTANLVLHVQP